LHHRLLFVHDKTLRKGRTPRSSRKIAWNIVNHDQSTAGSVSKFGKATAGPSTPLRSAQDDNAEVTGG
jgi:hypothetical protein